ncbi:MAG TPA: IclR family transcriptional regulator C-terminal domain-containing protein [Acidobacteriaceae bacterium]|nr:IclR family transcriptional regulator C-terminal domain-containing protein [Acidobacteriaceae bacterium]
MNWEYDCVRLQKFAIDRKECANDGICYCAPVFGARGQVSAAISSSMPKSRLRNGEQEKAIIAAVRATAEQVALDLQRD